MLMYWLIGGIALMLLEIVVPGLVLVFLGAGALVVALLIWLGVIATPIPAFTTWFIVSLVLILLLRGIFQRFTPGDEDWQSTDEDVDAMGKVVDVTETIPKGAQGRIAHQGTTWPATCYEQTLEAGSTAKLVYRENVVWVVEPCGDEPAELD